MIWDRFPAWLVFEKKGGGGGYMMWGCSACVAREGGEGYSSLSRAPQPRFVSTAAKDKSSSVSHLLICKYGVKENPLVRYRKAERMGSWLA
jgi:hypothetical protein